MSWLPGRSARDYIESREDIERRAAMGQARPAPEWIVSQCNGYRAKARLLLSIPQLIWLLTMGGAFIGFISEWTKRWKHVAWTVPVVWGAVDWMLGFSKRGNKYRKAAGILKTAIDKFETAQYADLAMLDAAAREAAAALE
jgi:hypothetical protein